MNDLERVERELYGDWDSYDAELADQLVAERYGRATLEKAQAKRSPDVAIGRGSPLACSLSSAATEPSVSFPVRDAGPARATNGTHTSGPSGTALK